MRSSAQSLQSFLQLGQYGLKYCYIFPMAHLFPSPPIDRDTWSTPGTSQAAYNHSSPEDLELRSWKEMKSYNVEQNNR